MIGVEAAGLTPETVGVPLHSFHLAAIAVEELTQHRDSHEQTAAWALSHGECLHSLTSALLEHPALAWWFEPIDLNRQVWVSYDDAKLDMTKWVRPGSPPREWERYAQKPAANQSTSTLKGDTASLIVAHEQGVGDYLIPPLLSYWEVQITADVNVYEVHGPNDWHNLCLQYPALGQDQSGHDREWLVPDWGAVSEEWDGVHLSLGGLLTTEQVRYQSPRGLSWLEWWHAEMTHWLRRIDAEAEQLTDHQKTEPLAYLFHNWPSPKLDDVVPLRKVGC